MNGRGWALALALAVPSAPPALAQDREGEASCRVCHSGPARGLERTPHRAQSCASCHGELTAHAELAMRPELPALAPVPTVAASSCRACHEQPPPVARAAHPLREAPEPTGTPRPGPDRRLLDELERNERGAGFDWSGLVEFGYRFVHVGGSRARFATDVDLEPGFRLRSFELEAHGGQEAFADQLRLRAHDIGDPFQGVDFRAEKDGRYRADARFRREVVRYAASGDFHRVDRRTLEHGYELSYELTGDLQLFAGFSRRSQDGFWLTSRIGNQNLSPLTAIGGVQSPRRYDGDLLEAGLTGRAGALSWTLAFEYLADHERDRWVFSRPAPANPAFPESEDFRSESTLRGPGFRWSLSLPAGPLTLDATGFYRDLDRRIAGDGTTAGFDVAEFTAVTDSDATGDARTWLADLTATAELSERLALVGELRWLDHAEDLALRQVEVTTFPSLMTSSTIVTNLDQATAQRKLEGSLEADLQPLESLSLSAGWGFAREFVRVPDLEAGDPDFRAGTLRNHGAILGLQWRPDAHWSLRGRYEDFGQNGVQLHELTEDDARRAEGHLAWRSDDITLGTFFRHRRSENDISRHHTEVNTTGLTATVHRARGLDLVAGYTFSDLDNRTLTNFYFDPDPNPVPTFVGFRGDTHTVTGSLIARPGARVRWEFTAAWTKTTGSFDVELLDWRAQVAWRWWRGGDFGAEYRQILYDEQAGADDYDAAMLFVFFRQAL